MSVLPTKNRSFLSKTSLRAKPNTDMSVINHIGSKHKGVRYPCDKCEYAATTARDMKRHIKIKHEGAIKEAIFNNEF